MSQKLWICVFPEVLEEENTKWRRRELSPSTANTICDYWVDFVRGSSDLYSDLVCSQWSPSRPWTPQSYHAYVLIWSITVSGNYIFYYTWRWPLSERSQSFPYIIHLLFTKDGLLSGLAAFKAANQPLFFVWQTVRLNAPSWTRNGLFVFQLFY